MKAQLKKFFTFFLISLLVFSTYSCSFKGKKTFEFNTGTIKVALVVSGTVSDSAWNAAAYNGLKRFQKDYNAKIAVVEKVALTDARTVFPELGQRGYDLVIANSHEYSHILMRAAKLFPETFFCVIGGDVYQEPNLCSFDFKDEQYGYLIGVVGGINTSTNKVGIVIGKKIPSVERTIIGIRQGLKSVNPKADLIVSYINTWDDINKGREAAINQINTGVDIITHLADTAGIGVIKAAEETDVSAIGAITDQHDLAPSTVITSGIQDASQLIYLVGEYYAEQILAPRIFRFGLYNQVIDLAPGYGNIEPTTETRILRIKNQLAEVEGNQLEEEARRTQQRH